MRATVAATRELLLDGGAVLGSDVVPQSSNIARMHRITWVDEEPYSRISVTPRVR